MGGRERERERERDPLCPSYQVWICLGTPAWLGCGGQEVGGDGTLATQKHGKTSPAGILPSSGGTGLERGYHGHSGAIPSGDALGPGAVLEPGVDVSEGVGEGGKLAAVGDATYSVLGKGGASLAVVSPNPPDCSGRSFNLAIDSYVVGGTTVMDDKVGDAHKLAEFVRSTFPSIARLLPEEAYADLAKARPRGNRTVICSRFHAGRVVLIGDAAHGMLNNLGQGGNAALEDCSVLMDILEEGGELDEALAKFTGTFPPPPPPPPGTRWRFVPPPTPLPSPACPHAVVSSSADCLGEGGGGGGGYHS